MCQLGGYALYLSPAEVKLGERESIPDVARVLSRYVDVIVARTFSHQTLETLAEYSRVPVINALSDLEHPCQALSDLFTIHEKKDGLKGLTLAFLGDGKVKQVELSSGRKIDADLVIIGIGAKANAELALKAGLEMGPTKGVQVNRYMRTSDLDIFACGDCAEKVSFYDGSPSGLKLASIATMEARIAGANLFQTQRSNNGVIGVYSTVLGNTAFCAAGLTENMAKEKGYNVITGVAEAPNRHPGSMPGMALLKVKLIFERGTHIILGGQISGAKSGGELINAISGCIHNRMTADDIATFQTGTHPALTASPIAYQLVNAAELALAAERKHG